MSRNAFCGAYRTSQHVVECLFSAMYGSCATDIPARVGWQSGPDAGKNTAEKTMERVFASIAAGDTNSSSLTGYI